MTDEEFEALADNYIRDESYEDFYERWELVAAERRALKERIRELEEALDGALEDSADRATQASEAEDRAERYREALVDIVRGEEEAPIGMSNPSAVARAALSEEVSDGR